MTDDRDRYHAAAHAMQSGIAQEIAVELESALREMHPHVAEKLLSHLKHLRVGVNSAMVEHSALVRVLMAKGLFSEAEYTAAIAEAFEQEARLYEERLTARLGVPVRLG